MTATQTAGRTFPVHDVAPATEPRAECPPHEAVQALLGSRVEALCEVAGRRVAGVGWHPLVAAAHLAWCGHHPFVLSPDMVWIAVLQGLAQHVKNDPERLRDRFVPFAGRKELAVFRDDLFAGSPENPWPEVVAAFSAEVRAGLTPGHAWLAADFSTTGPRERVAADVVLLDAMRPFFEYRSYAVCGIPAVTLEGTPADWRHLADKVERLADYDLGWWVEHLRPIARQFVRAADGDVDPDHWRNLYKRLDVYGGHWSNGWLLKLVPYLKDGYAGQFTRRNPLLAGPWEPYPPTPAVPQINRPYRRVFSPEEPAVYPKSLPSGVSAAPFAFVRRDGTEAAMEFLGGFLGVTQDAETLALRPYVGWAVRPRGPLDKLLLRLRAHPTRPALPPAELNAVLKRLRDERDRAYVDHFPGDFLAFYKACDGADLFPGPDGAPAYRVRGLAGLVPVEPPYPADFRPAMARRDGDRKVPVFGWLRFADLADGSYLALDFLTQAAEPDVPLDKATASRTWRDREVWLVVHCREGEADPRRAYRVVAWSFGEFLRLALASGGRPYWDEPDFAPRGDAFAPPRYAGEFPSDRVAEARHPSTPLP